MTWLTNAFSLAMLPDVARSRVSVERLSLEAARATCRDAQSAVGHGDTAVLFARILERDVTVERASIDLGPGDRLVVGQYIGPRLPAGVTELPEGARIDWMLVTVDPPPFVRVSPRWSDPAVRDALPRQWSGPPVGTLVAVPTNDSVVVALLALRPRRLLLLDTGGPTRAWADEIDAWVRRDAFPCRVEVIPDAEEGNLDERNLVAAIERGLGNANRATAGFLVTTGTSVHSALLTQLAHASGVRLVHVALPYGADGTPDLRSPHRTLHILRLPPEIAELYALRRARALLRGGSPREAHAALDECEPASPLVQATRMWIEVVDARGALRVEDAASACQRLSEFVERQPDRGVARWRALANCAERASKALAALADRGELRAIHLAAELHQHAERETAHGRWNLAALVYYRLAEAVVADRLLRQHGIAAAAGVSGEALGRARGGEVGAPLVELLPEAGAPIGLAHGLTLLVALRDALVPWPEPAEFLARFREAARARNMSLYAHGFAEVTEAQLSEWRGMVGEVLTFVQRAEPEGAWGRAVGLHRFVHLDDAGESTTR